MMLLSPAELDFYEIVQVLNLEICI